MELGDCVEYVDPVGEGHEALVTSVFGDPTSNPSINLVYVSADPTRTDQYGRQIERKTSVVHESKQSAHGNYWQEVSPPAGG